jgi:hypothetical protein
MIRIFHPQRWPRKEHDWTHAVIAEPIAHELAEGEINASTIRIDLDDYQSGNHSHQSDPAWRKIAHLRDKHCYKL